MNRQAHWLASPSVCADNPPSRHQLQYRYLYPVRHGGGGLRLFLSVTLKIGKKDLLVLRLLCCVVCRLPAERVAGGGARAALLMWAEGIS